MRNGTPMQRLRDRARRAVSPERIERLSEQRVEAAAETVSGVRAFEVVNVGGVDVKPFLDRTDGSALVDAAGLGAGVVETAAIGTSAIRPNPPVTNPTAISVNGLSAVGGDVNAAGASTVLSTSFTLAAGEEVTISFSSSLAFSNSETAELAVLLDYSGVHSMQAIRDVASAAPERYRVIFEPNPSGGGSSVSVTFALNLAAGAHTVLVLAMGENPGELSIPAGSSSVEVYVR